MSLCTGRILCAAFLLHLEGPGPGSGPPCRSLWAWAHRGLYVPYAPIWERTVSQNANMGASMGLHAKMLNAMPCTHAFAHVHMYACAHTNVDAYAYTFGGHMSTRVSISMSPAHFGFRPQYIRHNNTHATCPFLDFGHNTYAITIYMPPARFGFRVQEGHTRLRGRVIACV